MDTIIKDCVFTGVKENPNSIEVVTLVAKALLNFTELFRAQNIQIECLLKVMNPTEAEFTEEERYQPIMPDLDW